jgi:iron complex transport system substrate-binding protein
MSKTIEHTERGIVLPPQIVDDLTRQEFLIGAGLIVLAPACGSGGENDEASGETRIVEHKMGTTEVPVSPQRIVALDYASLECLIALGADIAGAVDPSQVTIRAEQDPEGIESVGDVMEPNLESVAALEPDLIVGVDFAAEGTYDQLSEIAPTLVFAEDDVYVAWKSYLTRMGEISGQEERAEELLSDYGERIDEFQEAMGGGLEETEVSIVRVRADGISLYDRGSFCGSVVEDAGLPRPESQRSEEYIVEISEERLDLAEGDALFVFASGTSDERRNRDQEALQELQADPLWQRLDVVQRGRAYEVGDHWLGSNIVAANLILDDLFEHLLESG